MSETTPENGQVQFIRFGDSPAQVIALPVAELLLRQLAAEGSPKFRKMLAEAMLGPKAARSRNTSQADQTPPAVDQAQQRWGRGRRE